MCFFFSYMNPSDLDFVFICVYVSVHVVYVCVCECACRLVYVYVVSIPEGVVWGVWVRGRQWVFPSIIL